MELKGVLMVVGCTLMTFAILQAAEDYGLNAHFVTNEQSSPNSQKGSEFIKDEKEANATDTQFKKEYHQKESQTAVFPNLKPSRTLRVGGERSWKRERHSADNFYTKRRGHYVMHHYPANSERAHSLEPISRSRRHGVAVLKSNKSPIIITRASHLRKDWCRTEPLRQRLKEKGCRPRTIQNRFCYGQCNSFYIPQENFDVQNTTAFQSCAFCKPFVSRWTNVLLQCPDLIPPVRKTRVLRVVKCRCISEVLR